MEFSHMGPGGHHHVGGGLIIGYGGGIRVLAQIVQRDGVHVFGGIEPIDAAVFQLGQDLGVKGDGPTVNLHARQAFCEGLRIVTNADGAPHIGDGVFLAGVERLHMGHDAGP